jgi:hypothetical protein
MVPRLRVPGRQVALCGGEQRSTRLATPLRASKMPMTPGAAASGRRSAPLAPQDRLSPIGAAWHAPAVDLHELTAHVEHVSRQSAERYGIARNSDWHILKLHEEVGELTQAHLMRQGQARRKGHDQCGTRCEIRRRDRRRRVPCAAHRQPPLHRRSERDRAEVAGPRTLIARVDMAAPRRRTPSPVTHASPAHATRRRRASADWGCVRGNEVRHLAPPAGAFRGTQSGPVSTSV